jgi:hypothetical protein
MFNLSFCGFIASLFSLHAISKISLELVSVQKFKKVNIVFPIPFAPAKLELALFMVLLNMSFFA